MFLMFRIRLVVSPCISENEMMENIEQIYMESRCQSMVRTGKFSFEI